jgi:hypothetical protein
MNGDGMERCIPEQCVPKRSVWDFLIPWTMRPLDDVSPEGCVPW